jgi:hypothetical protein
MQVGSKVTFMSTDLYLQLRLTDDEMLDFTNDTIHR